MKNNNSKDIIFLKTLLVCLFSWALMPNPYGYYILLRWIACAIFTYLVMLSYQHQAAPWVWIFAVLAGIYNPIIQTHLERELWQIVDISSILILIMHTIYMEKRKNKAIENNKPQFSNGLKNIFKKLSKTSVWHRILIVFSGVFILIVLISTNPWATKVTRFSARAARRVRRSRYSNTSEDLSSIINNWDDFFLYGVLPLVIFWGIFWIWQGYRKKKNKKKSKQNLEHEKIIKRIATMAKRSNKELNVLLFDAGFTIGEVEEMTNLYKKIQKTENRDIDLSEQNGYPDKKAHCPTCNSLFDIKKSSTNSAGVYICPECYKRSLATLVRQQTKIMDKKIFCPICKTVFKKGDGEIDPDGITICSDCYDKRTLKVKYNFGKKKQSYFYLLFIPLIITAITWIDYDIGLDTSSIGLMFCLSLSTLISYDISKFDMSRKWVIGIFIFPLICIPIYFIKTRKWYSILYFIFIYIGWVLFLLPFRFLGLYHP